MHFNNELIINFLLLGYFSTFSTFAFSQALYYNVGDNSGPLYGHNNISFENGTVLSINALDLTNYVGKNDTFIAIHNDTQIKQSVTSWNLENNVTLSKIDNIVLFNMTNSSNKSVSDISEPTEQMTKRDDEDNWYSSFCKSKQCNVTAATVTYLYNLVDSANSFLANLLQSMQIISEYVKKDSPKQGCGSDTVWIATRDGGEWQLAISIYTTGSNCDTTASKDDIRCALEYAVSDEEFHHKMAFCVRLDHGGTWHADCRFQRSWNPPFPNIWDMQCLSDNNLNYPYDKGCTEDHINDEL